MARARARARRGAAEAARRRCESAEQKRVRRRSVVFQAAGPAVGHEQWESLSATHRAPAPPPLIGQRRSRGKATCDAAAPS